MTNQKTQTNHVKIAHLSDIHFYETSDGRVDNYRHSIDCLKKIEEIFQKEKPDYLVVTGDLTNIGDKLSLERVYQWIHDKIYVDGDYYGLRTNERGIQTIVVPGNHDAFNAPTHGSNLNRWQNSLLNFHSIFHDQIYEDNDYSVGYKWIAKNGTNIFIAYVDSCFLGDHETEHIPGFLSIGKVAKGKFSRLQSETIMKLYDDGVKGNLLDSDGNRIPSKAFLRSLKMLAMHHYLFEPADCNQEPLLHLDDKRRVFQNLAMSDFDVLVCGHKHIADFCLLHYLDHFDPRGKLRLAFNLVRRSVGIHSLPIPTDEEGKLLSRMFQFVVSVMFLKFSKGGPLTDKNVNDIIDILTRALEDKAVLKDELMSYLRDRNGLDQTGLFDEQEIRHLHSAIVRHFNHNQKRKLIVGANSLRTLVARLGGRPFAHVMSGSSGKANEKNSRRRALNIYSIVDDEEGINFHAKRFTWNEGAIAKNGTRGVFSSPSNQTIHFSHSRSHSTVESSESTEATL